MSEQIQSVGRRKRAHAAGLAQNAASHPVTLSEELEK